MQERSTFNGEGYLPPTSSKNPAYAEAAINKTTTVTRPSIAVSERSRGVAKASKADDEGRDEVVGPGRARVATKRH